MISSTGFRIAVTDQENKTLTNRKSNVIKSVRKPLGDRAINQTPQKCVNSMPFKDRNLSTQKKDVAEKPKESKVYPEWFGDTCSFKEVDDNYEDIIYPKSERIQVPELLKSILNPVTPPIKNVEFNLPPLQSPLRKISPYDDDDISEILIADVEIPNLSF